MNHHPITSCLSSFYNHIPDPYSICLNLQLLPKVLDFFTSMHMDKAKCVGGILN